MRGLGLDGTSNEAIAFLNGEDMSAFTLPSLDQI